MEDTTVLRLHKAPSVLVQKLKIAAVKSNMTLNDFTVRLLEHAIVQNDVEREILRGQTRKWIVSKLSKK